MSYPLDIIYPYIYLDHLVILCWGLKRTTILVSMVAVLLHGSTVIDIERNVHSIYLHQYWGCFYGLRLVCLIDCLVVWLSAWSFHYLVDWVANLLIFLKYAKFIYNNYILLIPKSKHNEHHREVSLEATAVGFHLLSSVRPWGAVLWNFCKCLSLNTHPCNTRPTNSPE